MINPTHSRPGDIPIPTAFALVLTVFVALIGLSFLFATWGLFGASLALALATLVPLAALLSFNPSYRTQLTLSRSNARSICGSILLGSGLWFVVAHGLGPVLERLTSPEELQRLEALFAESTIPLALRLLLIGVVPGICEELLFRGVLQRSLLKRFPPGKAILISATVFGLFHLSPARFVSSAFIGLLLGLLSYRYQSLWPAILVHSLNNCSAIAAMHFWGVETSFWLAAYCVPATVFGGYLVFRR